jgi:hypothetical protein
MSVVAQRTYEMNGSQGHFIEYKNSLKKANIIIEYKHWIIIDSVTYNILNYTHTKDKHNDYYTFNTITNGSVKYLIVWDVKHKNILIQKVKINKH